MQWIIVVYNIHQADHGQFVPIQFSPLWFGWLRTSFQTRKKDKKTGLKIYITLIRYQYLSIVIKQKYFLALSCIAHQRPQTLAISFNQCKHHRWNESLTSKLPLRCLPYHLNIFTGWLFYYLLLFFQSAKGRVQLKILVVFTTKTGGGGPANY